jgi:hypothetical protein
MKINMLDMSKQRGDPTPSYVKYHSLLYFYSLNINLPATHILMRRVFELHGIADRIPSVLLYSLKVSVCHRT